MDPQLIVRAQRGDERAFADQQADLCFTDPPHNVAMGDHGGQGRGRQKRRIANDAMDPTAWEAFVRGFARTILTSTNGAVYCCMSSKSSVGSTTSVPTSRSGMAGAKG